MIVVERSRKERDKIFCDHCEINGHDVHTFQIETQVKATERHYTKAK